MISVISSGPGQCRARGCSLDRGAAGVGSLQHRRRQHRDQGLPTRLAWGNQSGCAAAGSARESSPAARLADARGDATDLARPHGADAPEAVASLACLASVRLTVHGRQAAEVAIAGRPS